MIYEEGKIVEQDLKKAEEWYRKAGIHKISR
jgi:TPR repeat protein